MESLESTTEPKLHFWSINALVNEFKESTLTERRKMHYYVLLSLLTVLWLYVPYNYTSFFDLLLNVFLVAMLTIWVVVYCYRANELGDGRNFIERFVCLGFIASIRFMAYLFLVFIGFVILGIILAIAGFNDPLSNPLISISVSVGSMIAVLILIYYYARTIRNAMKEISLSGKV